MSVHIGRSLSRIVDWEWENYGEGARWPSWLPGALRDRPALHMYAANDGDGGPGATWYGMDTRARRTRAERRERQRELLDEMAEQRREGADGAHWYANWECPF